MDGISVAVHVPAGQPHCRVLVARGYLDASNGLRLENAVDEQISSGVRHLVFDLAGVDYVSSAGWGIFVSASGRLRDLGGELSLVGMQDDVVEIYRLLEFHTIIDAYADLEEALEVRC